MSGIPFRHHVHVAVQHDRGAPGRAPDDPDDIPQTVHPVLIVSQGLHLLEDPPGNIPFPSRKRGNPNEILGECQGVLEGGFF